MNNVCIGKENKFYCNAVSFGFLIPFSFELPHGTESPVIDQQILQNFP